MRKLQLACVCGLFVAVASAQLTRDQKISDFLNLAGLYAKRYAPYEWKREVYGFDLFDLRPWLDQAAKSKDDPDFYDVCVRYVASLRSGGHDRFLVPSTFAARLNFTVDIYDGKVLVDSIDRARLPAAEYPFQIGDELVSVDGKSAEELLRELEPYGVTSAPGSARRSAAGAITVRSQQRIPRLIDLGDTASVVIRRQSGALETYTITWRKTGIPLTRIGPAPDLRAAMLRRSADAQEAEEPGYMAVLQGLQDARAYGTDTVLGSGSLTPIFNLPRGFVQRLGRTAGDHFFSGSFQAEGFTIGFIRIPSYSPTNAAAAIRQFENEMIYFQQNTDGLVIDDMRNPGGSVSYLNALVQRVMPRRFRVLGFEVRATSSWIESFSRSLEQAKAARAEQWIIDLFQYALDDVLRANAENRGRTGPLPVDGPSLERDPSTGPDGRITAYTKPLMVLADEFSASGGDAFPATIQDNGRGPVFGMPTMGLGGTVSNFQVTAHSEGVTRVTMSLMNRKNLVVARGFPASPYVENVGVLPDIEADYMTRDNLMNGGASFVSAFTSAMVEWIKASR